jgi:hydrogenase nickel incorporation protein HypB
MCDTCGCGDHKEGFVIRKPSENVNEENFHVHSHEHSHNDHTHHHHHEGETEHVELNKKILGQNDLLAERNRGFFEAKEIVTLNLVSSPGSGKTSILVKTLEQLKNDIPMAVIEGDQRTSLDAARIMETGVSVVQVNTQTGCHLDAAMVNAALKELTVPQNGILIIENVGNLVCPALFDLGEQFRILVVSVTEGDDKPLKYPYMFASAHLCLINKIDLLPYVDFDINKFKDNALRTNHHLQFIELSARTEEGMQTWYSWLKETRKDE